MAWSTTERARGLGQQHRLGSVSQIPTFVYAFMLSTSQDKEMAPSPMRDNRRQRRRQDHVPTVQRPDLLVISWYVTAVEQGIGDENRAPPPLVQNALRWLACGACSPAAFDEQWVRLSGEARPEARNCQEESWLGSTSRCTRRKRAMRELLLSSMTGSLSPSRHGE